MANKTFSPKEAWETLLKEERILRRTVPRLKVSEPIVSTLFVLLHIICSVVTFYPFLIVNYIDDPTQTVKELPLLSGIAQKILAVAENSQSMTAGIWACCIVLIFLVCFVVALILRLFWITPPKRPEALSEDYLTAVKQVIQKANQVKALSRTKPSLALRAFLGLLVMVLAVVVLIFLAFDSSQPDFISVLIASLFMMIPYCGLSMITFAILQNTLMRQEPDYLECHHLLKQAEAARSDEEKRLKAELEEKKRLEAIDSASKAFLIGDFDGAKKIISGISSQDCGDILAIQTLSNVQLGQEENGSRKAYKLLWDAKELGFHNDGIRSAVDCALEQIKPLMLEQCQSELFEVYTDFLAKRYRSAINKAEKLTQYGHPDAIMVMLVCFTEVQNNPRKYPEWLELAKKAKRRGFDPLYDEIFNELITKLEIAIRQNAAYEEARKNRPSVSPLYTASPPEASGWYDFRTGETLYRVNGRIVNSKGEEVSPAWWC